MISAEPLREPESVSHHVLDILQAEGNLPICTACGTQYGSARLTCYICEDPRQAVPASGQSWTSLTELSQGEGKRRNTLARDKDDPRVSFIGTEPGFAINQTPILLETASGSYIWDCSAFISTALVDYLSTGLKSPLKAIAVSHPHFFCTSLTWSRLLRVPLYLNAADKEWYARQEDIREQTSAAQAGSSHNEGDRVIWWTGEQELGPGVKVIQCGGHFAGSSVLHWDRLLEPPPPAPGPDDKPTRHLPVSGLLLTADTIMVQPTQRGFTFIWSVPNSIPLGPHDVVAIQRRLASVPFGQASSSWPGKFVRENAKEKLAMSVRLHLRAMGWEEDTAIEAGLRPDEGVVKLSPNSTSVALSATRPPTELGSTSMPDSSLNHMASSSAADGASDTNQEGRENTELPGPDPEGSTNVGQTDRRGVDDQGGNQPALMFSSMFR